MAKSPETTPPNQGRRWMTKGDWRRYKWSAFILLGLNRAIHGDFLPPWGLEFLTRINPQRWYYYQYSEDYYRSESYQDAESFRASDRGFSRDEWSVRGSEDSASGDWGYAGGYCPACDYRCRCEAAQYQCRCEDTRDYPPSQDRGQDRDYPPSQDRGQDRDYPPSQDRGQDRDYRHSQDWSQFHDDYHSHLHPDQEAPSRRYSSGSRYTMCECDRYSWSS